MQTLLSPKKVMSMKTTQAQLDWLHALQSAMQTDNRSQTIKRLLDIFVQHIDYPFLHDTAIEDAIIYDLFNDSHYTLHDLDHLLTVYQYNSTTSAHTTVMISIKFSAEERKILDKLHQLGLVMSRSEALRFIVSFFITLLSRLITKYGDEDDD